MNLKYKIVDADDKNIRIQITEQEWHQPIGETGEPAGGGKCRNDLIFNGIVFRSMCSPAFYPNGVMITGMAKDCFCLRGSITGRDNDIINIPIPDWPKVYKAIQEYNAYVIPKKHTIQIDGKTIEISEESFNALKNSLT